MNNETLTSCREKEPIHIEGDYHHYEIRDNNFFGATFGLADEEKLIEKVMTRLIELHRRHQQTPGVELSEHPVSAGDAQQEAAMNPDPMPTNPKELEAEAQQYADSPFLKFFASEKDARYILLWLHKEVGKAKTDPERVLPLAALCHRQIINKRVRYDDYVAEFGHVAPATYSRCMGQNTQFLLSDYTRILKGLPD